MAGDIANINSEGAPIHPDIEAGASHVLEERLVDAVSTGNDAGIRVGIRDLSEAWIQAQKAADSSFEFTPEGREQIPGQVKAICGQHLQQGIGRVYVVAGWEVSKGLEFAIEEEPKRIEALFGIADEFGIPISYLPEEGQVQPTSNTPAVPITNVDQAKSYMQEVINRNLPKGIKGLIQTLGSQVSLGFLQQLPEFEENIEKWIGIMQQRGYTVVDEPTPFPIEGEEAQALLKREVNRFEVRQLIDQAVKGNLAKGADRISRMVAFNVKNGLSNPTSTWGSAENIALYTEAGEKYDLTNENSPTARNSEVDSTMYFDPTKLPEMVRKAVTENLQAGLEAIGKHHLSSIRSGDAGHTMYQEGVMDEYIGLAEGYEVTINGDELKQTLASHIIVDNLQQGVVGRITAIREALRQAKYSAVSISAKDAEEYRKFVAERGFTNQVDFSSLDMYLKETATQVPQLTAQNP